MLKALLEFIWTIAAKPFLSKHNLHYSRRLSGAISILNPVLNPLKRSG